MGAPAKRRGGSGGRRDRHQLSNSVEDAPNLAAFQLTAELPLSVDFVFTGSLPQGQVCFPTTFVGQSQSKVHAQHSHNHCAVH